MNSKVEFLDYSKTNSFSKIIIDYLDQKESLQPFYDKFPTKESIRLQIVEKQRQITDRTTLYEIVKEQYKALPKNDTINQNIEHLLSENTFTITTAHQPNLLSGPLYFFYKIFHAIALANYCKKEFAQYNFVPVFYMGSEDADVDELAHLQINGTKHYWKTNQKGAFGRFKIDDELISLINKIEAELSPLKYGDEISSFIKNTFTKDTTIQQATLELVHELLGKYGVIVLIADDKRFKKQMHNVFQKELLQQYSQSVIQTTSQKINSLYKAQAQGREINLFYLKDDIRERIEFLNETFQVHNTNISFTKDELLLELEQYPERFSPNVILRGLFQETILPNIAFVGGGGEIAYWMQLKDLFNDAKICFPILVLRNSFLLRTEKQHTYWNQLGFQTEDLFTDSFSLENKYVNANTTNNLSLTEDKDNLQKMYEQIQSKVEKIDLTLNEHTKALHKKHLTKIEALEKKMLRAEKRNMADAIQKIRKIKSSLFPDNSLQERTENFLPFYAKYGSEFFDAILTNSLAIKQQFCVLNIG